MFKLFHYLFLSLLSHTLSFSRVLYTRASDTPSAEDKMITALYRVNAVKCLSASRSRIQSHLH